MKANFTALKMALDDALEETSDAEVREFVEDHLDVKISLKYTNKANTRQNQTKYTFAWCATRLANQHGMALALREVNSESARLRELVLEKGTNLDHLVTVIKWHGANWRNKFVPRAMNAWELNIKWEKLMTAMENPMCYEVDPKDAEYVSSKLGRYFALDAPLHKFVQFHSTCNQVIAALSTMQKTISEDDWNSDPITGRTSKYDVHSRLLRMLANLPFIDDLAEKFEGSTNRIEYKFADKITRDYLTKMGDDCRKLFVDLAQTVVGLPEDMENKNPALMPVFNNKKVL